MRNIIRGEPKPTGSGNTGERSPLEDELLIARAQGGDAGAFEALVRRYQEAAFRAAFLVLHDAAEAEDAAQEALVKAYRSLGRFRPGSAFRPWLLKIVMNQALTRAKSRSRRAEVAERAARMQPLDYSIDETVMDRERARPSTCATSSRYRRRSWRSTWAARRGQ